MFDNEEIDVDVEECDSDEMDRFEPVLGVFRPDSDSDECVL